MSDSRGEKRERKNSGGGGAVESGGGAGEGGDVNRTGNGEETGEAGSREKQTLSNPPSPHPTPLR